MDLSQFLLAHEQKNPAFSTHPSQGADRLAQAARSLLFDFLLHHGAAFLQPLVFGDRVVSARLWEIEEESLSSCLRLGSASSKLLESLQQALQNDKDKESKLPTPSLQGGEAFFFHAVYERVLADTKIKNFQSSLLRVSPLSRLVECPLLPSFPTLSLHRGKIGRSALNAEEMAALQKHPLLAYLSSFLADAWAEIPPPSDKEEGLAQKIEEIHARTATIQMFLQAIEQTQRLSLLAAPVFFFRRLARGWKSEGIRKIRTFRGWPTTSREQYLSAYGSLYRLGQTLEETIQSQIVRPGSFGWKAPHEARIFTSRTSRSWSSDGLRETIAQLERSLR